MSIYADKALEKYNITYKELEKLWDGGYIKKEKQKAKFWTELYTFDTEEEYKDWEKWCLTKVKPEQFNNIDMLYSLGQPYLFKENKYETDDSSY